MNLVEQTIEVYGEPNFTGYGSKRIVRPGDKVTPRAFGDAVIDVGELLKRPVVGRQKTLAWGRHFPHSLPTMNSMTGYGRGECSRDGFKITVELSSVNRKQGEISVLLPRELEVLEAQIRDVVNQSIARGRVTARVTLHAAENKASGRVRLNAPLARAYVRELNRLGRELKLPGRVRWTCWPARRASWKRARNRPTPRISGRPSSRHCNRRCATLLKCGSAKARIWRRTSPSASPSCGKARRRFRSRRPRVQERFREQLIQRVKDAGVSPPARG